MAMIAGFAPLAAIAAGAQRLQIVRRQAQVPVIRERLDVIDIHARAVAGRAAAEAAGRLSGQVRIAQAVPFLCLVEPSDQCRRCPLAADERTQQPG